MVVLILWVVSIKLDHLDWPLAPRGNKDALPESADEIAGFELVLSRNGIDCPYQLDQRTELLSMLGAPPSRQLDDLVNEFEQDLLLQYQVAHCLYSQSLLNPLGSDYLVDVHYSEEDVVGLVEDSLSLG